MDRGTPVSGRTYWAFECQSDYLIAGNNRRRSQRVAGIGCRPRTNCRMAKRWQTAHFRLSEIQVLGYSYLMGSSPCHPLARWYMCSQVLRPVRNSVGSSYCTLTSPVRADPRRTTRCSSWSTANTPTAASFVLLAKYEPWRPVVV